MKPVTWDLLICSIPHRHAKLVSLLEELDRQMQPGAGAIAYPDNLETPYGSKCDALVRASAAEYVSFLDDDDWVAPDFISRIMAALQSRPDYVGFPVRWTQDGTLQIPVEHSLRHKGWADAPELLKRDFAQFNPIRRDLAMLGTWEGGYEAERRWAAGVRDSGKAVQEAWIPDPMYYYRESLGDTFKTVRQPLPPREIWPLPSYPWLAVL